MTTKTSIATQASRAPRRRAAPDGRTLRALGWQALLLAAIAAVVWFLISNTLHNLAARNIATGFGFLDAEAGFAIGESPIAYTPADTYARALWVGVLNTLKVSVVGIVAATLLGTLLGLARLSRNGLLAGLAGAYVEVMRNVPLLLQLFFWYALITQGTPGPRQALQPLPGVYLSNRGLVLPALHGQGWAWPAVALALGLLLWAAWRWWAARARLAPAWRAAGGWLACVAVVVTVVAAWAGGALAVHWEVPVLRGFNFRGGLAVSPEFAALLTGLVLYTSAFVAEVVRSGVQAVPAGQWQAALALGLSRGQALRRVVLPQALRLMVPPMTSQYLNLTKNSSLAVAIGYPDIVSIANTTLNQTGQAIEGVLLIMAAYLTVSLSISVLMNWYNRRVALVER